MNSLEIIVLSMSLFCVLWLVAQDAKEVEIFEVQQKILQEFTTNFTKKP